MHISKIFLSIVTLLLMTATSHAQDGTDNANLFEKFEGNWILHTHYQQPDGSIFKQDAELRVRRLESHQAPIFMFEERHETHDDSGVYIGRILYAYHKETDQWRGTGVNTLANRKWRDVSTVDGNIVFIETGELFDGRSGKNRATYKNITDNSFELSSENSDDGETWRPARYGFTAERIN